MLSEFASMHQCYITFNRDNLLPFYGNYYGNIVLQHIMTAMGIAVFSVNYHIKFL
jgi:hypothetical protein